MSQASICIVWDTTVGEENWKGNSPLRIQEQSSSQSRSTAYHVSDLQILAQFSKASVNVVWAAQIDMPPAPKPIAM